MAGTPQTTDPRPRVSGLNDMAGTIPTSGPRPKVMARPVTVPIQTVCKYCRTLSNETTGNCRNCGAPRRVK